MKNRYISVLPCSDTWTYSLQHIRYTKRSPHTQTPSDALVIMNTCLSRNGGTALIQQIRQMNPMPILALSETISMADKAAVLKCGADDVLNKPYNLEECLARAQALMRRYTQFNHITGRNDALVSHGDTPSVSGHICQDYLILRCPLFQCWGKAAHQFRYIPSL